MKINSLSEDPNEMAYSETYLRVLDNHHRFLSREPQTYMPVSDALNISNMGDFLGLLTALRIEKKYHLVILEFNGYRHPADYSNDIVTVAVPSTALMDELLNLQYVN